MTTSYEDKSDIRELQSTYCFRMDDGDYAGVAALFTPDGAWLTSYETAHGREQIEAVLTRINPDKNGPFRKHIIANGLIDLDGDSATSRTSYLVIADTGSGPSPIIVGVYVDRLLRVDGQWQLAERTLVHEIRGDLLLRLADPEPS